MKKTITTILPLSLILASCGSGAAPVETSASTTSETTEAMTGVLFRRSRRRTAADALVITSEFKKDIPANVIKSVSAGDNAVDVVLDRPNSTLSAAQQGARDYSVENLYEVVEAGNWTIDCMIDTAKGICHDLNGDSKFDLEDMYGFIANNFCTDCFIGCSVSSANSASLLPAMTRTSCRGSKSAL